MSFLSIRGIVIRSVLHKENDRIIGILTREHGIVHAIVPGAGKPSSRFAYSTKPLMLCDFVLAKTRDFYYLRESEIVEPFLPVQEDIEKLTAAAHMLEITSDVCVDRESAGEMYPLILYGLYALARKESDYRLIVSIFEWKVPDLLGFTADLNGCSCGEESTQYVFSFTACRLFCTRQSCLVKAGSYLYASQGAVDALKFIYTAPMGKLFNFSVSVKVLDELSKISRRYLCERLEKKYSRMELLSEGPVWNASPDSGK
jgi:DNA repair protein RecO (recombination protein O)